MNPRDVVLRPIVSEKSMDGIANGKYTFVVDKRATKSQIKDAVEQIFKVKVKDVNTMHVLGKMRRMGIHRGRKSSWKKAVVTLQEGQRIEFFEGMV